MDDRAKTENASRDAIVSARGRPERKQLLEMNN